MMHIETFRITSCVKTFRRPRSTAQPARRHKTRETVAELDIARRRYRPMFRPEQVTMSNQMPYCGCKGIMIITTFRSHLSVDETTSETRGASCRNGGHDYYPNTRRACAIRPALSSDYRCCGGHCCRCYRGLPRSIFVISNPTIGREARNPIVKHQRIQIASSDCPKWPRRAGNAFGGDRSCNRLYNS
jgi:hypothetical protein